MKNIQSVVLKALLAFVLMFSVACRDVSQSRGTDAGERSNGETRGTEKPADNENSGKSDGTETDSGAPPANKNNPDKNKAAHGKSE